MTLYEIDAAILEAFEKAVDPETGEVLDENIMAELDALQMAREEKCENIACWIKDLEGDAVKIRAEANNLLARGRGLENQAARLRKYLAYALHGEKLKTARCAVSYRKSQQVEVDPDALACLRDDLLRFKDPEPDKKAIKAALDAGEELPGCRLVENVSMIIK